MWYLFEKHAPNGLFVVSDLEQCCNFGKNNIAEKELTSSRSNVELLNENKICISYRAVLSTVWTIFSKFLIFC